MNLANKLTLMRIFMVPIFMIVLLTRIPYGQFIAAFIFILAASTDGLDGYIARTRKQVTKLGKFMDPLADKLLISAALISLVELDKIPAWIAIVIISREFAVSGLRSIAASEGIVIAASALGKVKTVTQIVAIVIILLEDWLVSFLGVYLGTPVLYLAVIVTIISGLDYFIKGKKLLKDVNK
ncbi:CDP-diacylglycerol--glycerol-3-phosphate 3-phosphatidyltransferase [Desulfitispora alkaliphila]|uniref:CDP-diacylglycerol--glycerol-3-phosphate 3-phosphatidyltransferase n=1 Tax=Desulfitispora alkaliphila TaxID=622674 RepID=UPI003D2614FB